jgi:hypothetical protein
MPEPDEPEPVPEGDVLEALEPEAPASSRLEQAPRDRAATTARTAAVVWVIDFFMGKLLEWVGGGVAGGACTMREAAAMGETLMRPPRGGVGTGSALL